MTEFFRGKQCNLVVLKVNESLFGKMDPLIICPSMPRVDSVFLLTCRSC